MFSKTKGCFPCIGGAQLVDIEVDISKGLHVFNIVGLTDKSISEAKERVSGALKNTGFISPKTQNQKITVALSPASLKKEGVYFDLAIAVGYLIASKQLTYNPRDAIFCGELSLDGSVKKVRGIISIIHKSHVEKIKEIYIPYENISEAQLLAKQIDIYPVKSIRHLFFHLYGSTKIQKLRYRENLNTKKDLVLNQNIKNLSESFLIDNIKSNDRAKRILEIALAGKHHAIFWGPAGVGKTMLAKAAEELLPSLSETEVIEYASHNHEYVKVNKTCSENLFPSPFRNPHHSISYAALIGNGKQLGEITLAHKGVLFLDELAEFDTRALESLRQPLEEKVIRISRSNIKCTLPCDFILLASMNPCPCGGWGSKHKTCSCTYGVINKYRKKLSEALINRISLWGHIDYQDKTNNDSRVEKKGVDIIKNIKRVRGVVEKNINFGTKVNLTAAAHAILKNAGERLLMSERAIQNTRKIAETIRLIDQKEIVTEECILEALQYRYQEH